jgi:membrane protein
MRLPTPRIEDATLKRKYRIQVIFAFLAMLSWYLFLYSNNLLEYMEQDLGENYQEILIILFPFYYIIFAFLIFLWYLKIPKVVNYLIFAAYLFAILTYNFSIFTAPVLFCVLIFILYDMLLQKEVIEILKRSQVVFLLFGLLFFSAEEIIFGAPYSPQQMEESSLRLQNWIIGTAIFTLLLSVVLIFIRIKNSKK